MNDIEKEERTTSESSEIKEKKSKKSAKQKKKTQGQMIQEAYGLSSTEIQAIEKKLFMVRFLDYFSEQTLDFIFKDNSLNQYIKQITTYIEDFDIIREEDRLLKPSFESKKIVETIHKLKGKAEELAISKGVKGSMDKRLRNLTLMITLPLFVVIFALAFLPIDMFLLLPILCVFCMLPQVLRGRVVKKWYNFKEQNKHEIYAESREDIMILKGFAGETLDNIRSRLLELEVPLQLIKFMLHSRDYENLRLLNQKNIRGSMQYFYTFEYPPEVEPFPIPEQLQQLQPQMFAERRKTEKMEKNFIVLTEMKGVDGIIQSFVPTLKDRLAEDINEMLNNSEFSKAPKDFEEIIPKYSETMAIYCICGEVVDVVNVQICNWKNQFKFYLFEGKECKYGEVVYAISLINESDEVPEDLKDIFYS
ncbi:MAG: hypothetical protein ACFFDN_20035 [Candidatus Hodarchaeota archaeon]